MKEKIPAGYKPVVFADDLPDCDCCEEKWCPIHNKHYWECDCFGPTQDGVTYKIIDGKVYGKLSH